jgi:hypothetical protein
MTIEETPKKEFIKGIFRSIWGIIRYRKFLLFIDKGNIIRMEMQKMNSKVVINLCDDLKRDMLETQMDYQRQQATLKEFGDILYGDGDTDTGE